jgi:hypothetical protein
VFGTYFALGKATRAFRGGLHPEDRQALGVDLTQKVINLTNVAATPVQPQDGFPPGRVSNGVPLPPPNGRRRLIPDGVIRGSGPVEGQGAGDCCSTVTW